MMDRLDAMRLFVRVVDRRSFTGAASDLGIPRSTATEGIKRLEAALGRRLLDRTTRHVEPTQDGAGYYRRCLSILADVEEAESDLRGAEPEGILRVDAHGRITRTFLLPALPAFLARYPKLDIHLGQNDRLVDLVREGVDCAIRAGVPDDSGLIMRRLTALPEITCASPDYFDRHGIPATPDDLEGHLCIGYLSSRTGAVLPLEFQVDGKLREVPVPSRVTVNDAETMHDLALLGFGLIQAPRYRFQEGLAQGRMIEVLSEFAPPPTPLVALYPQNRLLSPRVRVFLDWVGEIFARAVP